MKQPGLSITLGFLTLLVVVESVALWNFADDLSSLRATVNQLSDQLQQSALSPSSSSNASAAAPEVVPPAAPPRSNASSAPVYNGNATIGVVPQAAPTEVAPLPTLPDGVSFTQFRGVLDSALAAFDANDRNHDDTLQSDELPPADTNTLQIFQAYDLNRDGEIDRNELKAVDGLLKRSVNYVERHDRRHDGFPIEQENFDGNRREFVYVDTDHDGALTDQEHYQFLLKSRAERRRFDVNQDGDVGFEEFGGSRSRFDLLDRNHDGVIDSWEIGNALVNGKW